MKKINETYAAFVRENFEQSVVDGSLVKRYMDASTAVYHGTPQPCLYMPKIFSRQAWKFLQAAAADIHRILEKVIARYIDDAKYRRLFAFEAELEKLILSDAGYSRLLPIARLDIFFNEDDFSFKFCEFNADGASAMNEDRAINNALRLSDVFAKFAAEHDLRSCELFDSWVFEFGRILGTIDRKKFFVAIVDFLDGAIGNEFILFRDTFRRAGFDCEICEIRSLVYEVGELRTASGVRIDAIYRRAVTCDIMRQRDEVRPFLQATLDGAVYVVGHFRTQVIHNKIIFEILRREETLAFLTADEREFVLRHVPETFPLVRGAFDLDDVLRNKNDWIIKPEDSYAARGVFAGVDMDSDAWAAAVKDATDSDSSDSNSQKSERFSRSGYLLQKYCPPYRTENLDFNASECPEFQTYNNITGMYVYSGNLAGLYSRAGLAGVISGGTSGLTMASVVEGE